jgi:phospholipid-binding lipoprotein MlaA
MRNSVTNFFSNLGLPSTIVNQLLQGKPVAAGQDTLRFAMNLTLGIGGLFDPASDANLPRHDEDLGQTLGRWGVPPGPYLTLPLLGPSHLRDVPSIVANRFLEPFYWYNYGNERWISLGLSILDTRARLLPLDATLQRAYDRDAYSQRRLFQVYDGDVPEELLAPDEAEFEDDYDEEAGDGLGDDAADASTEDAPTEDAPADAAPPPPHGAGSTAGDASDSAGDAQAG